ncbi:hypothetical protein [Brevundimonas sp.]|uniref:hypothetical protein n=1 Tax=Brevundimonas sp. TaxID=1871086 RepID=UPI001ACA03FA|nr:hypothetical protein [Brevundimonas sp.]MBN9464945.1 hypothetical protein [Brevundimonas sp.]
MGSILTRQRLMAALIALFVAMLVLVPSIDAVACSAEFEPSHAAQVVNDDPSDADGIGSPHGVCSHGHCHHAGTDRNGGLDADARPSMAGGSRAVSGDDLLSSRVPAGPERPPRV